ncbi:MAG TPA: hypothetical protein VGM58_06290 [Verrucomicrobiae bacterium]|jgi:hypothetical protein
MKTFIALFFVLSVPCVTFAQINYSIATQQARRAGDQSAAASQGNAPHSTQPAPPAQNSPPMDPVLAATLQNIANLRSDFDGLKINVAPDRSFTNDLASAAKETKASTASVSKLADDLQAAIAGNDKLRPKHQKLAQDIHAIFNGAHLSSEQEQMVYDDVQKILQDGGTPDDVTANLLDDIKEIAKETK